MNPCAPRSNRNARTFIVSLLAYLLLTSQLAPLAHAANVKANRARLAEPVPEKSSSASELKPKAANIAPASLPLPQPAPMPLAINIVATKTDNRTVAQPAAPGDTINYTVVIQNTGTTDATGVQLTDIIDANTTLVPSSIVSTPVANPDTFNVIGNVRIQPNAAQGLLANDFNPDNGDVTGLTASGPATSTQGGNVTVNADGSFSYNPPVGFAGTDTFTYTLTVTATAKTDTATVTLNVGNGTATPGTNVVWFINPAAAAGGDGRLTTPFNCYTGAGCFSAVAADEIGDSIFLFSGAHTGGNTLLNNQKLIGQGASATLASIAGLTVPTGSDALPATSGASPTITTAIPATVGVPLGQDNTLRGFTVGDVTGTKISGNTFGTLTVGNNTTPDVILNGTGRALGLTTGTFAATSGFVSVATTSSTAQGIQLTGVAGTVSFGSTSVSGSTSQGIVVSTSTADINFGNTTVGTGTAASGGTNSVSLQNNASGTRTFGTLTIQNNTGAGQSAFLSSAGGNTVAGTTNLSGIVATGFGIDIRALAAGTSASFGATTVSKTTAGAAVNLGISGSGNAGNVTFLSLNATNTSGDALIAADNTGTITVTNNTGSLSATNGVALNITKAIAPLTPVDMDFANVSSSGATNGINLLNVSGTITTTGGALTATGTVFNLSGGTVSMTYSGNISQANNAALVFIGGGHATGTINFNTGTLLATGGTGGQFDNADGIYNFNGQFSCNGGDSGVDILNGSDGTFTFAASANISNPSGIPFVINGGTASVTYNGAITKTNSATPTVNITNGHSTGTITFQGGAITANIGTGLLLSNADGIYNFSVASGNTILAGGDAGIDIVTGSSGTFTFGGGVGIVNPTGIAYQETVSSPNVTFNGSINQSNAASAVVVGSKSGGTTTFNGAIVASTSTASAISLTSNVGGTINFTGGLNLTTTSGVGFNATGGGTVTATQNNTSIVNTISSTTGIALNVTTTTIGASGLTFRSISSNGAANGIVLGTTGASGSLIVSGNGGSCTSAATCTGGAIQNSTNHAISLTSTLSPSFTRIAIQNAARSGIDGQQVTNFTLANSFIDNVGTGAVGQHDESSISFNDNGTFTTTTLSGTVSITNNTLTNARRHGIQIENGSGTISNLTISNNTLTSSTNSTVSLGNAIEVLQQGSAATASHLTTGTINANTITNFPSGEGILIAGGTGNSTNNTSATLGANGTPINITNNRVSGQAAAGQHTGSNAIRVSMNSQVGVMNANISCNGNTTLPCTASGVITNIEGQTVSAFAGGSITGTTTIDNNVSVLNHTVMAGTAGIAVQVDDGPAGAGTSAADYNFNITNNRVSQYDGFGIRAIARASLGKMDITIQNNQVGSTIQLTNRNAIRVDSGSAVGDTTLCLNMTGNAGVGGSPNKLTGSGVNAGIGLRKQGTVAGTNEFGIVGISASPTNLTVQTFVGGNNLSNDGPGGSGSVSGVDIISGSSYLSCTQTAAPISFSKTQSASLGLTGEIPHREPAEQAAQVDAIASQPVVAPAPVVAQLISPVVKPRIEYKNWLTKDISWIHTDGAARGVVESPELQREDEKSQAKDDPKKSITPKGITPNVANFPISIGTLGAGKSVTITFSVTVNNPLPGGTTQVSNQGTVSGSNFASLLTDDPDTGAPNDPTITGIVAAPDISARDARAAEPTSGTSNMLFTVALSIPAPGPVSVNFATANGGATPATAGVCGSGGDYVTTSGTVNFTAGQRLQTVAVPICSDGTVEPDETLLLNLSTPVGGNIADGQAVGTITAANPPGDAQITELRTSGPGGAGDDFVELYNNSDSQVVVAADDASPGVGLFKMGAACGDTPVLIGTIPNGTIIPARGHYLFVGSAYSLGAYAAGDATLTADIENDRNIGFFSTTDPGNLSTDTRLDAVGFGTNTGGNCDLLREGTNLQPAAGSTSQYSFVRKLTTGLPQDINDNAADFAVVATDPTVAVGSNPTPVLGAPGPENAASPIQRNATIKASLIDPAVASSAPPNRVRDNTSYIDTLTPSAPNGGVPASNPYTLGTLLIRRKFTNNTGAPVTRLRFRVVDITSTNAPPGGAGQSDLRAMSSSTATVTITGGSMIGVQGLTLEQPPTQNRGGGLNSGLAAGTITLGTPLASGANITVNLLLGVATPGSFRFFINVEALP